MIKIKKEKNFISSFNDATGEYIRTGIIENGSVTDTDPFMASFPELIDIGIMGHCIHGSTGLCIKAGVECYQDGLHSTRPNMSIDDFRHIAEECRGRTFQFALGGCGDPDQHENFEEILKISRDAGIVPNFTTSGFGMTKDLAALCKKYCGAVAVSWYRSEYTRNAIRLLLEAKVKTNIHYVLTKKSISEAYELLINNDFPQGINAIVFLLHKPIGLGKTANMVTKEDEMFWKIIDAIRKKKFNYRIGFDSCTVPALIGRRSNIDPDSLDTCEGARWSAYISSDMKMMPCSFDNQDQKWAVDLNNTSISEAWYSNAFEDFRSHFRRSCPDCRNREKCMGGCPICPEIVLCKYRTQ